VPQLDKGHRFYQASNGLLSTDDKGIGQNEIPNNEVAKFIDSKSLDDLAEHAQDFVHVLSDINLEHLTTQKMKTNTPRFDRPRFNNAKQDFTSKFQSPNFEHMFRAHKFGRRSHSTKSALQKFVSLFDKDIVFAKHQARVESLGDDFCPRKCGAGEWECNCKWLFACVLDMDYYDLAVMIAGGYIDNESGSNNYGNFSVWVDSLSLFDAEEGVKDKLTRIKAAAQNSGDLGQCKAVLSQLFSACDPSKTTCSDPNVESYEVSVDHVCDSVQSSKKLLVETIGDEFDGFTDESVKGQIEGCPLSFDVCRDFVSVLDEMYDATGKVNPMRKNQSISLHDKDTQSIFQHTQVRYQCQSLLSTYISHHQCSLATVSYRVSLPPRHSRN
jgi:hypothetical protein